jgi:competence protein CoiA
MMLARMASGDLATPRYSGELATCPNCSGEVFGRCGRIVTHHWAHKGTDCDPWAEPETLWHYEWKTSLEAQGAKIEQTISRRGECHRADCVFPDGTVLEIQRSPISVEDIERREAFYGRNMVWLFDTREAVEHERLDIRRKPDKDTFRWKQPRKSIAFCRRGVYLDICNDELFYLYRMYPDPPCGGIGEIVSASVAFFEFLQI